MDNCRIGDKDVIIAELVHACEWQRGRQSDFKRALIHLITRADVQNLEKLRLGFPDEVEGFVSYKTLDYWWPELEARMDEPVCTSCALDKHSCIDVEGHAKVTGCANHVPKPETEAPGMGEFHQHFMEGTET